MDLCRQPTTAPAKILCSAMLDACCVLMSPDNRAVELLNLCMVTVRDGGQDAIPDTRASPPHEPVVAGHVGAVSLWQIPSRRSRPRDPEVAIQDTPVVHAQSKVCFLDAVKPTAEKAGASFMDARRGSL